jgi:hypothetical protein
MAHRAHLAHPKHPEHPDNHPHRLHHPHSGALRAVIGVYLAFVLVIMVALGFITDAPFGNVLLSFAPSVLFGLAAITLLNNDHLDTKYLFVVLVALLVVSWLSMPFLAPGADIGSVTALNMILGGLLVVILALSHHGERSPVIEEDAAEQDIPTVIATIEDRCKAINFVIGRVYNVHKGATAGMRDKIKLDSEWYNELSAALESADENQNILRGAIERIKRRLMLLHKQEKEVFSAAEITRLKKLERKADGTSRVLFVLAANDEDPIEQYVASAEEYCELALARLRD